jgi:Undecaprenyl-phosphate glucose phosphotransferase
LAWVLSYWVRFSSGLLEIEKGIPPFAAYLKLLLFVWLIWAFVFKRFGLYRAKRGANRIEEAWTVIKANALAVLLLLSITYLFREKSIEFSRLVFVIFWGLATVSTIVSRMLVRSFLRNLRRRGYNLRYALIVGAERLAADVARRLIAHPEFGIELTGCLARDSHALTSNGHLRLHCSSGKRVVSANGSLLRIKEQEEDEPLYSEMPEEIPVLGTYEDLPRILAKGKIDQVIVALPLAEGDLMESVVHSIGDAMVDIRIVPDFHRFIQLGSLVEEFDGLPVVSLASTPLSGINRIVKRGMDLVLGTVFIALSSPLFLLTALTVKLTSRGPVFYRQERVGLDGQSFDIYKFRTMFTDAEAQGAKFAVEGDPRVTPLGRFMRKYSIDEIPQLMNVVLGQMSLVGPRPERPVFIEEFRRRFPGYMLRHKVQAGLTGWAQVNGWRGNTSIQKRIEHDLYYIENWSVALDLKILFKTITHTLRGDNAY